MIIIHSTLNFCILTGGLWMMAMSNSESDKWSWPTSGAHQQQVAVANNRKDIYYERFENDPKSERIRVPTSYYDSSNRRQQSQQYQAKDSTTNRPKPLSDEFSNELSGEGYSGSVNFNGVYNNRYPPNGNFPPNRFGPQQQQQPHTNDFQPQFGYSPYQGIGGLPQQNYPIGGVGGGGLGLGGFGNHIGGAGQGYPGQFFGGGAGDPYQQYNLHNGLLVGPGGPSGILGRPGFGRYPGGNFGAYPQQFGGYPNQQQHFGGFDGHQQNGLGGLGQYNPAFAGGGGGFGNPYLGGIGGGVGPAQFPARPLFDSAGRNSDVKKKIEKSAE